MPTGADAELEDLERRFWLVGGGDPDFWREHFADDGLVLLPHGIMDKARTVAAMEQALPWADVEMTDLQVRHLGDDMALLAYAARASREGAPNDYWAVISSLYVRRDGEWQLFCHQQSPVGAISV